MLHTVMYKYIKLYWPQRKTPSARAFLRSLFKMIALSKVERQ